MRTAVAVGGAMGSLGRVALGELWTAAGPWGTWAELTVNLTGAFLLAVLIARVEDPVWRAGLGTGVLGAWTTVSALGHGVAVRLLDGDVVQGLAYAAMTLVGGVVAAGLGARLADRGASGVAA